MQIESTTHFHPQLASKAEKVFPIPLNRKTLRSETEIKLQNELNKAKKAVETNPSDSNASLLDAAQKQLESFYEEKTKGIIVRARARWHENGEKSTKIS